MLETILVVTLFLTYLLLWKIKNNQLRRSAGINAEVMKTSTSNIQRYMAGFSTLLSFYALIIVILHAFNIQYKSLFSRFDPFSSMPFDLAGLFIGLIGLGICLYAQIKMGASWRVGIDEKNRTDLVTTGLYRLIRNPTYLGLFLLNLGVWLIWPTWTVFLLNILFIVFLEVQVRCEEDFLTSTHGEKYLVYKKNTKRYIPFIY
jgi:protein-S-isoprenylcysteine O-methyltransferase Ste14